MTEADLKHSTARHLMVAALKGEGFPVEVDDTPKNRLLFQRMVDEELPHGGTWDIPAEITDV